MSTGRSKSAASISKWREETPWGRLFDRYEREEHLGGEPPVERTPGAWLVREAA